MTSSNGRLTAVMLDWAGTTVDFGSRAPARVFQEVFQRRDVPITAAQAREPMGMAKREHIAAIGAMPEVAQLWLERHGRPFAEQDIDAIYAEFLPLQKEILAAYSDVIPGIVDAVAACRQRGLKIGSTTGYTRELMETVSSVAAGQGYVPDCIVGADDAPRGRPAPFLLFEAAKRMNVFPLWTTVAVDDTPVGIQAGRNAGCWTVGITRTGNCVGYSEAELAALPARDVERLCAAAEAKLRGAGAHYILASLAELPAVLLEIEQRLQRGELPLP
jgi:phosphonoacetaldehyde hydrolase